MWFTLHIVDDSKPNRRTTRPTTKKLAHGGTTTTVMRRSITFIRRASYKVTTANDDGLHFNVSEPRAQRWDPTQTGGSGF